MYGSPSHTTVSHSRFPSGVYWRIPASRPICCRTIITLSYEFGLTKHGSRAFTFTFDTACLDGIPAAGFGGSALVVTEVFVSKFCTSILDLSLPDAVSSSSSATRISVLVLQLRQICNLRLYSVLQVVHFLPNACWCCFLANNPSMWSVIPPSLTYKIKQNKKKREKGKTKINWQYQKPLTNWIKF